MIGRFWDRLQDLLQWLLATLGEAFVPDKKDQCPRCGRPLP